MTDQISISFLIKNISTVEFSIRNLSEVKNLPKESFHFQILPKSSVDINNNIISIDTIINISADQEKQLKICELITHMEYEVLNLNFFVNPENNSIKLPDNFIQTLISISISTSRGILAAKTEGTVLKDIFLPVVDPRSFKPKSKIK